MKRRIYAQSGEAMSNRNVAVGKYIRERREALHLTQKEFTEKLKVFGLGREIGTLSDWERGKQHIQFEHLPHIAQALGESPLGLYAAAGLLDTVPNVPLILALSRLTQEQQHLVELLVDAVLKAENKT